MSLITKLFGTYSQRQLKKVGVIADRVDALEEKYAAMSDAELKSTTQTLKDRLLFSFTLFRLQLSGNFNTNQRLAQR